MLSADGDSGRLYVRLCPHMCVVGGPQCFLSALHKMTSGVVGVDILEPSQPKSSLNRHNASLQKPFVTCKVSVCGCPCVGGGVSIQASPESL